LADLRNEFSWSTSRDRLFRQCKRAYYYHYYGSWGGWDENANPHVREAYILKNLTSGKAWAGAHVHRAVSRILRSLKRGSLSPEDAIIYATLKEMRNDYAQSVSGAYREKPKKACGLFEHEYGFDKSPDYWKSLADGVVSCIRNFYSSDLFGVIVDTDPSSWLVLEGDGFDGGRNSFVFEGDTIYAKIDFAFAEDGCVYIVDWKTGRELLGDDDPLQFHTYALYGMEKWGVSLDELCLIEANLSIPESQEVELSSDQLVALVDYIRSSICEMKAFLVDPVNNVAEMWDFPKEEGRHCDWCNFRRLCGRG